MTSATIIIDADFRFIENPTTADLIEEVRAIRVQVGVKIVEIQGAMISVILRLMNAEGPDRLADILNEARIPVEEYSIEGGVRSLISFMSAPALAAPTLTALCGVTMLAHREHLDPDRIVTFLKEGHGLEKIYRTRVAKPQENPRSGKKDDAAADNDQQPPVLRGEAPQPPEGSDAERQPARTAGTLSNMQTMPIRDDITCLRSDCDWLPVASDPSGIT